MPELTIIVPTLGRPQALEPLLTSIEETTPEGIYRVRFVIDSDDAPTYRELDRLDRPYIEVQVENGTYPHKVNAAAAVVETEWLFITADDVRFHPGWWEATAEAREADVGVIGTNDLHNRHVAAGKYATQFLINRLYVKHFGTIDERGKVFCEQYWHAGIDVEVCETAMARGMYAHAHKSVVEHLHPNHGNREIDDTDRKGNLRFRAEDRALVKKRRKLWRGLSDDDGSLSGN